MQFHRGQRLALKQRRGDRFDRAPVRDDQAVSFVDRARKARCTTIEQVQSFAQIMLAVCP